MSAALKDKIAPALHALAVDIGQLWEDPENARDHDAVSLDAAANSLEQFGQQKPIVIAADGRVIAGNGIYRAAKVLGWPVLAAVTFVGDEEAARAYAIADNRTAELSTWDRQRLASEIGALKAAGIDGHALGFGAAELAQLEKLAAESAVPQAGDPADWGGTGGGDGSQGGHAAAESMGDVFATALEFQTEDEQTQWFAFLSSLRTRFPDALTHGDRLAAYVQQLTEA